MIAVGEGAQAASDQGHGAEAGTGLAGRVRAGGVLLAVLAVPWGLQPVVCAGERHLHGSWLKVTLSRTVLFSSPDYLLCGFLCDAGSQRS